MFKVNGNTLLADEIDILIELKEQLAANGIYRFAQFKVGVNNIQFNCPIHNNGQERKPSCGILLNDRNNIPAGTVNCFSCGYTATLEEMISHCFGYNDFGAYGRDWLTRNFLTVAVENRKDLELDFSRSCNDNITSYVSDEELESYAFYSEYVLSRGITEDIIDLYDVGEDRHFELKNKKGETTIILDCATFPVRDECGNTLFIARRDIHSKIFHYPEGVDKPVYGLYELDKDADEIIVCESIFDALTCRVYGKQAVALLGTGTERQYAQLRALSCRKMITAFDNDEAGNRATVKFKEHLKDSKIVTHYELPINKDVNDLTKEEFDNLVEYF